MDDPNTVQAADLFEEQLGALGVETVYDETYAPDQSNFDAIANSIKEADPDLVIHGAVGGDGAALVLAFQKVGFSPEDAPPAERSDRPGLPRADRRGQHRRHLRPDRLQREAASRRNAEFVAGYTEAYGAAPSEDAANSYTAGQVLATAVEAVGEIDQDKIADWLHSNTVETIVGPLSWDEAGPPAGRAAPGPVPGRRDRVVAPAEAATVDEIIYAKPDWQ